MLSRSHSLQINHQVSLSLDIFEHRPADVFLIRLDSLVVTRTKPSEQFQESSMFLLCQAQLYQVDNRSLLYLVLEQLIVVFQQLCDSDLGEETVIVVRDHSLAEELIDPLGDIVLIQDVVFDTKFEEAVDELANASYGMVLGQLLDVVLFKAGHERIDQAVYN